MRLRSSVVEALYPRTCAGCGLRGTWVCAFCEPTVPKLATGICYRCGGPASRSCRLCQQLDRSISQARAAYPYTGWAARAVRSYKYADEWDRGPDLAARMVPMIRSFGELDGIVPVPLHPRKLRQRGYNQAEILARTLSVATGVPIMPLLIRSRETRPQVELDREDRHANMRNAFALDPGWSPEPGGRYVMVDDVRTTGATLNACARVLIRTAPQAIYAATFALDLPPGLLREWMDENEPARAPGRNC